MSLGYSSLVTGGGRGQRKGHKEHRRWHGDGVIGGDMGKAFSTSTNFKPMKLFYFFIFHHLCGANCSTFSRQLVLVDQNHFLFRDF